MPNLGLNKDFFERKSNIKAKVVADSISSITGVRLTTFEVECPRFILPEINTHRMISKNCSSSRAIPVEKMLEQIEENMAVPTYFGKNKSGMQACEEVNFSDLAKKFWIMCGKSALADSKVILRDFGLHKQISNRITEPYQMVKILLTATEWDNFFNLRIHPTAQPEIAMLAYKMYQAMISSTPKVLKCGDWHLPYVDMVDVDGDGEYQYFSSDGEKIQQIDIDTAIKVSVSCSAQTSYRKNDQSIEKAERIFDMLINTDVIHASPFEHVACPIRPLSKDNQEWFNVNVPEEPETWQDGVTHVTKDGSLWSGNFKGWVSYRHSKVVGNTCKEFDFKERMKLFSNC